jgi:hypothetical protein
MPLPYGNSVPRFRDLEEIIARASRGKLQEGSCEQVQPGTKEEGTG